MSIGNLSLQGKVAIVTGGRRGLGKAIALAFAEAGANVAICDLVKDDGLKAAADEIEKFGRRSLAIQADISRKADVNNLVKQVISIFNNIDILVNNAGIGTRIPLIECDESNWDSLIDTNLKGCFLCSQAVAKIMIEQKSGNIINLASIAAFEANTLNGAYGISKAGVVQLTRLLALELAKYNIRVNAIAPGLVKTELTRDIWENPEILKHLVTNMPLGRLAEATDISAAALFLASDMSRYITGHIILVDGGFMLR